MSRLAGVAETSGTRGVKPRFGSTLGAVFAVTCLLAAGVGCGGAPPQIVDYSPLRGAQDVSTAAPVSLSFDHPVDKASVASRLHLVPDTEGTIRWLSPQRLVIDHA